MTIDQRTPVIVGVAQMNQRPKDPARSLEPFRLMVETVVRAAADSGTDRLLAALQWVGVIQGAWGYRDPGRLVADHLGLAGIPTALTTMGGQAPQTTLHLLCSRIQQGNLDCAVITGAETIRSRRRLRRQGGALSTTKQQGDVAPTEVVGQELAMSTEFERQRGADEPIVIYPIFESAIRAANGETLSGHRDRLGRLWARFNEVAVDNVHAWSRDRLSADEIRNTGPGNRMVGFPYTKAMNSNWDLDQAAAVIVCSAGKARSLGVPRDRWVFPWYAAQANDTPSISNRRDLCSSPAISAAGGQLFERCGIGPDDIDHIDLYSCFPSAVQMAAQALGIDLGRTLTVTGGLTFAGGPLNNYVGHSLATMTDVIREHGGTGLVTANGGYATKHSLGLYRADPGPESFAVSDVQPIVDRIPDTPADESFVGRGIIEAYTVMHDRDGPTHGVCALRTPDRARTWARVTDNAGIEALLHQEGVGRAALIDNQGQAELAADGDD